MKRLTNLWLKYKKLDNKKFQKETTKMTLTVTNKPKQKTMHKKKISATLQRKFLCNWIKKPASSVHATLPSRHHYHSPYLLQSLLGMRRMSENI